MGTIAEPVKFGAANGPVNGYMKGRMVVVPCSITMPATYASGGDTLTLPTDMKGHDLRSIIVANPIPAIADLGFGWNGSVTAPKITAMVLSTGLEVAGGNAAANGKVVQLVLIYEV